MAAMLRRGSTRAHRNDDGIPLDRRTIDLDTSDPGPTADHPGDLSEMQFSALRLRSPHHRSGKFFGVYLGGGFRRAQTLADADISGQPIDAVGVIALPQAQGAAIGGEPTIVPVAADLFGQPRMQGKAAPCEAFERCPVTPVEC